MAHLARDWLCRRRLVRNYGRHSWLVRHARHGFPHPALIARLVPSLNCWRGIAQLGRASGLGPEGRRFESGCPDCLCKIGRSLTDQSCGVVERMVSGIHGCNDYGTCDDRTSTNRFHVELVCANFNCICNGGRLCSVQSNCEFVPWAKKCWRHKGNARGKRHGRYWHHAQAFQYSFLCVGHDLLGIRRGNYFPVPMGRHLHAT